MKIENGMRVKHVYSSYRGVVTGRAVYASGYVSVLVTSPTLDKGAPIGSKWFEECDVEQIVD